MFEILKLMRTKQYVKNLFMFLPLFFSLNLFNFGLFFKTFLGFILFSITASSIYILNDINDINEDKNHPDKKERPIASGKISLSKAKLIMIFLLLVGLTGSFLLNLNFFFILIFYFLMNIAYSLKLKHIAIVDIFIIATGFVLRVFAGGVIGEITCSKWIILMTFLLALFIGLAKRRNDILLAVKGLTIRKNIDGYNLDFINSSIIIMGAITIVAYIQYTVSKEVINQFGTDYIYLTTFFVLLGFLRYLQITLVENNSGSPSELLVKDKFLIFSILGWMLSFLFIVY